LRGGFFLVLLALLVGGFGLCVGLAVGSMRITRLPVRVITPASELVGVLVLVGLRVMVMVLCNFRGVVHAVCYSFQCVEISRRAVFYWVGSVTPKSGKHDLGVTNRVRCNRIGLF
jgi:hypothetical protein